MRLATNGNGKHYALRRRTRRGLRRKSDGGGARSPLVGAVMVLGILGALIVMAAGIAGIAVYSSYARGLQPPDKLLINTPSYGAKILDRNGKLLYEYVDDRSGLRRPIKLEDISPAFLAATIATEDDSFMTNWKYWAGSRPSSESEPRCRSR